MPSDSAAQRQPWCPVCRQQVATDGNYSPVSGGFFESFAEHGCDGSGRRVKDADYGYVKDGEVVPSWEF